MHKSIRAFPDRRAGHWGFVCHTLSPCRALDRARPCRFAQSHVQTAVKQVYAELNRRDQLLSMPIILAQALNVACCRAAVVNDSVSEAVFASARDSVLALSSSACLDDAAPATSAIVWDNVGHLITNYGAVAAAKRATPGRQELVVCGVNDQGENVSLPVTVVAADAASDVAVVQMTDLSFSLLPIAQGSSNDLKVGQYVFSIGATYGAPVSLSAGIVSGLNRAVRSPTGALMYGVIQTDAPVGRAGRAGGALVDSSGRLVGMVTAGRRGIGGPGAPQQAGGEPQGRGSGIFFGLPIDQLRIIVPNLIVYGNAKGRGI